MWMPKKTAGVPAKNMEVLVPMYVGRMGIVVGKEPMITDVVQGKDAKGIIVVSRSLNLSKIQHSK